MAAPLFHVPLGLLRRMIIDRARIINAQNDDDLSGPLDFTVVDENHNTLATITGTINIIRNAMTPNVFGANVTVTGHYFNVAAGEAMVDYDLILQQVGDNTFIGQRSIRIRGFDLIRSDNINDFVDQVQEQILNDWQ